MTVGNAGTARTVPLAVHAAQARALVAALRDAGIDDAASLELSLESETNLPAALGEAVARIADIEAMIGALDRRADEIAARKVTLRERIARIKGAVVSALELADVRSVATAHGTVYLVAGPARARIVDDAVIPPEFLRSKTTTEPDRAAIGRALAAGIVVPGCLLSNGQTTLGIRR